MGSRTWRGLAIAVVVGMAVGCTGGGEPEAPRPESLVTMREAAQASEAAWGVPADLTLAVSYAETRWELPQPDEHDDGELHEGHAPGVIGVGALKPWLAHDPIGTAERMLGVSRDRIATEPVVGILATAAVLRDLAERRYGDELPSAGEVAGWYEVVGDYAGLDDEASRASYAEDVYTFLRRGVETRAADGTILRLAARPVTLPERVLSAIGYAGAEYDGARWVAASTSNYTSGRAGESVRYVVIHTMQGSYAGAISWFQNPAASASAHYNIRSSDGEITQMVSERDTAWHAGNLTYNRRSVGIEHEGYVADPGRWYTDAMYRSSAALTRHLCDKYGIPIDRAHIIGHNEVPHPTIAGRYGGASGHTDPGSGWDWDRFMELVRGAGVDLPDYDAEFVGKDHPTEMVSGERAVAWIDLRNNGSRTWDLDGTRVGTTGPNDHPSPFFDAENWLNDHRATAPDHSNYDTGATGRFTFMIKAPEVTEPTLVRDTFGLVQEGVAWFGPSDITFEIMVRPRETTTPPADPVPTDPDCVETTCDPGSTPTDPPGTGGGAVPPLEEMPPARGTMTGRGCSASGAATPASALPIFVVAAIFAIRIRRRRR